MIVCSCNLISSRDIVEAVLALRSNDPFIVLTPPSFTVLSVSALRAAIACRSSLGQLARRPL